MKKEPDKIKEWLSSYISLRMETNNQMERIERMKAEEQFPAMREPDGSAHTAGGNDRMAGAIIRRMEYEEKVRPQIEANKAEMSRIEDAINLVPSAMERELLRLRYIDGQHCKLAPWREVCLRIYGDEEENHLRSVYRLHGEALQSLREKNKK